ncbi:tRNA (adenosine(37)-N6)-threonylcarbamoyltransferase complex dimerization subunit type 1 TsaB [Tengunoibacter tsumagoiensis]|uniref:tRNA (Adenosine(37)-N6)-threonylcarbamoyltransferase complex dimerization subunit type 1 TsaB n=1 Tax=Tengunoibacter tsumagoiensis TaxID=2014871 RepID=A0A402A284_9CHLR|nr:tRNA (adenosine(37)-N6)-threonylcarbamoyltransferase complex dimerization subunit type 1 TsaB [Tengunoibacter tsumagoiensis]GCE13165.1 tRNA (adenosine(37)-N6)-threonylcarbamoyltransferase complex dimerization subunit type 1 TsaB [Tengunoibacter tsumagoiensis]
MLLLALDTSTHQSSIALCTTTDLLAEYSWSSTNNHSVELLERIERLFTDCHLTLPDVDGIAVATGPGSFNGVRVAVASAKALAFALQKPLIGISTLEIIAAHQLYNNSALLCTALEAGRSELYTGFYRWQTVTPTEEPALVQIGDYQLGTPQQVLAVLQQLTDGGATELCFSGEIRAVSRQSFQQHWPAPITFISGVAASRRASVLARLAETRILRGQSDDPHTLEPLYLRRPSITTSTRKRPLLGGQPPIGPHTTEREEGALRH